MSKAPDVQGDRGEDLARLRLLIEQTGTAPERRRSPVDAGVQVHPCLRPLIPDGQLRRGTIVAVTDRVAPWPAGGGASYLTIAMLAGAAAGGAWCAAVGCPDLGIAAAAGLGVDLRRLLLVDEVPAERWADVLAILADAVDLLVVRAPARPSSELLRRVGARVRTTERQRGTVLVVAGSWPGAHLRLESEDPQWTGLGEGSGHLTGRKVTITASGRGIGHQQRSVRLWLPAVDGGIAEDVLLSQPREGTDRRRLRIA